MMTSRDIIQRQIISFAVVGTAATLTDFIIYWFLHQHLAYSVAKSCSFVASSIFVYLCNKFFTFRQKNHAYQEILRFILLYGFTLLINVGSNSYVLYLARTFFDSIWQEHTKLIVLLAFLIATGISTIINFLGQKLWVFKQ